MPLQYSEKCSVWHWFLRCQFLAACLLLLIWVETLSLFHTSGTQAFLKQFERVDDRGTSLVLWGPSRSGKTRFAMSDVFGSKPYIVDVGETGARNGRLEH